MRTLVTGVAGFIGFHCARALAARGDEVTGIDNLNSYYDTALKAAESLEETLHSLNAAIHLLTARARPAAA